MTLILILLFETLVIKCESKSGVFGLTPVRRKSQDFGWLTFTNYIYIISGVWFS